MTTSAAATDPVDCAALIDDSIARVTALIPTWLAWDGRPIVSDGNVWTPHKALRRVCDHLLDHLAEVDALLAGLTPIPDTWYGRVVTTDSDRAGFTEVDLNEAGNRLARLALMYRSRIAGLSAAELDAPRPEAWTIREIVVHVAEVSWYADQVGNLTP